MVEIEQGESPSKKKKAWRGLLQIGISILLLGWLLSRVGMATVIDQLASLDAGFYALAGLVFLLSIAARAVRWRVLLTPLGVKASLSQLFSLYLLGFFWNSFLPTGFGGDAAKAIELRRVTGKGAAAVTSVLSERVLGLFATSLIGLLAILLRPSLFPIEAIVIVVGMCLSIAVGIWMIRLDLLSWFAEKFPFTKPITANKKLISLHKALRMYDRRTLILGLAASVPFTFTSILDNYLVGRALGVPLTIDYYALYTPIISIVGLLPLSFNGLGVREYAYQVLFGLANVPAEQAIAMALAFNLLRFGAGMLGGLVSAIRGMRRASGENEITYEQTQ